MLPDKVRRKILKKSAAIAGIPLLSAALTGFLYPRRGQAAATPECLAANLTRAQTAGPFYTPNSPLRSSLLEGGGKGQSMRLSGRVLNQSCQPIAGAVLDFWHADDAGIYDNEGYRLRGHLFTDEQGMFTLNTIIPGLYPGRTRHIHVIAQAENTRLLVTQLYFPGEAANRNDFAYDTRLELRRMPMKHDFEFDFFLQS